jgi:chromosome partitioning protein
MIYAIGTLKGGSGKTLTAVMIAILLAIGGYPLRILAAAAGLNGGRLARPRRVLLVDADPAQDQASAWARKAGAAWPVGCTVIRITSRDLASELAPHLASYDDVVLDLGPKNEHVMRQALGLADHLIVPSRPTGQDVRELRKVLSMAAEVDAGRPDDRPLTAAVLLTQVQTITTDEAEARALLDSWQVPVMAARVRMLVRWSGAFGTVPRDARAAADYADVVGELVA